MHSQVRATSSASACSCATCSTASGGEPVPHVLRRLDCPTPPECGANAQSRRAREEAFDAGREAGRFMPAEPALPVGQRTWSSAARPLSPGTAPTPSRPTPTDRSYRFSEPRVLLRALLVAASVATRLPSGGGHALSAAPAPGLGLAPQLRPLSGLAGDLYCVAPARPPLAVVGALGGGWRHRGRHPILGLVGEAAVADVAEVVRP